MKQHYCFLERFNNYFNRKIIKHDSLLEYQNNSKSFFIPVDSQGAMLPFDFNPNDNVMTEIIANEVPFDPDYFLLLDDAQNIVQRWFVLEQKRNRKGQWLYTLRRDVVSDNIETLYDAPIFVEKGMLQEEDVMVLNDEGMSLNQIKTSETLLKDKTNSAWIVGYLAKNAVAEDVNIPLPSKKKTIDSVSLSEIAQRLGISELSLISLLNIDIGDNNYLECFNYINPVVRLSETYPISRPQLWLRARYNPDDLSYINTIEGTANQNQGFTSNILKIFDYGVYQQIYNNYIGKFINPLSASILTNAERIKNEIKTILSFSEYFGPSDYAVLQEYRDATISYLGNYYRFKIDLVSSSYRRVTNFNLNNYEYLDIAFKYAITQAGGSSSYNNSVISLETFTTRLKITLEKIPEDVSGEGSIATKVTSSRTKTIGQEFDAFAIPYNPVTLNNNGTLEELTGEYAQRVSAELARMLDAQLYDVQLLPYCPFPELVNNNGEIDISSLTIDKDFNYIVLTPASSDSVEIIISDFIIPEPDPDEPPYNASATLLTRLPTTTSITNLTAQVEDPDSTGLIFDVSASAIDESGQKAILVTYKSLTRDNEELVNAGIKIIVNFDYEIPEEDIESRNIGALFYLQNVSFETKLNYPLNLFKNMKFDSNCNLYRIVSPNYQGTFDFNVARNGGKVDYFIASCTYKPYTPFIKVAPLFSGLYGGNFGDNRGLICGGDFSLPRTNSAWESYQLNNKNYQNIFNREIQNLEFMQSIERRNSIISGAVGILSDATKGAGAGAYIGGATGGIIGGVLGAGTSAVGFGVDVDTLARTQREQKQLAIDKFNYQLGNIKALPYTLTKVGAFDIASKIFPFLEFYTCSEEEASAFESKIQWESMTVMRIGTLREFMNFDTIIHYFKGHLIRNDEIADDPHILNAIYEELLKGVYI